MELIISCDLVIAAESAKIGDGHANFGIIRAAAGRSACRARSPWPGLRLLFTGNLLPARELAEYGLVNQVVPDEQLTEAVQALLAQITKNSPLGVRLIKQLINDGYEQPLDTALRLEVVAWEAMA